MNCLLLLWMFWLHGCLVFATFKIHCWPVIICYGSIAVASNTPKLVKTGRTVMLVTFLDMPSVDTSFSIITCMASCLQVLFPTGETCHRPLWDHTTLQLWLWIFLNLPLMPPSLTQVCMILARYFTHWYKCCYKLWLMWYLDQCTSSINERYPRINNIIM